MKRKFGAWGMALGGYDWFGLGPWEERVDRAGMKSAVTAAEERAKAAHDNADDAENYKPQALVGGSAGDDLFGTRYEGALGIDSENQEHDAGNEYGNRYDLIHGRNS